MADGAAFVSIVLPCRDEVTTVGDVVREALDGLASAGLAGEVVVVDNGSTDGSAAAATDAGARVVDEERPGYGAALRAGLLAARGDVFVMADADGTYDLANVGTLIDALADADLVIADRFDQLEADAMPMLHRRVGTPVLSLLVRRLSGGTIGLRDSQSGYRAARTEALRALQLRSDGMEFASEMLIRAGRAGWSVASVALPYGARRGESKLRTFTDGGRHLRLLAWMTPDLVLRWPGRVLGVIGVLATLVSLLSPAGLDIGGVSWQPIFFAPIAFVLATLLLVAAAAVDDADQTSRRRTGGLRRSWTRAGVALIAAGVAIDVALFVRWLSTDDETVWELGIAFAAVAQSALLTGGVLCASSFVHWVVERRVEDADRSVVE